MEEPKNGKRPFLKIEYVVVSARTVDHVLAAARPHGCRYGHWSVCRQEEALVLLWSKRQPGGKWWDGRE
eukprot:5767655-Amphidinium_carterae.2